MSTVDDFLGSRLGLRSSRVSSHSKFGDYAEKEQLLATSSLDKGNLIETKKSQGRSWKAKQEDYDEDNIFGLRTNENDSTIPLQRLKATTQPIGMSRF